MASVKFDNTEILNTTYIPRYVKHESATDRILNILNLARENGDILISERYGIKRILLIGILTAATKSALETAIDSFKELFSHKEKNLDIEWEAGTRRYVATCGKHDFDRDHFNNLFVPWTAEFVVASGVGKEITETAILHNSAISLVADYDSSVVLAGSAKPKPKFTVKFNHADWPSYGAKGIALINRDTNEQIVFNYSAGLANLAELVFDCELRKVTYAGNEVSFYGVFPDFKIGTNLFRIRPGGITDQSFEGTLNTSLEYSVHGAFWKAQSFSVPFTDNTYKCLEVYMRKVGTPVGTLFVRIETDNNGKPSGTLVHANAEASMTGGDFGVGYAWVNCPFTGLFTLTAGVRYWIVIKSPASTAGNTYTICFATGLDATYKRGNVSISASSGATWGDMDTDLRFILKYGGDRGGGATVLDIDYYKRFL